MSTPGTSPSSSRDLTLVVESESGTPEEYFAQVGLCIGRASSNTIVIDHEDLDRIHARIVKQDDAFWLQCEPNAPSLQVLEPEPGEVEKVEIQPGLAITLGGIVIRCRRQFRGMMGEDDDYWANAIGGEKFKEDREGFTGWLPKQVGPYQIRRYVARGGMGIVLQGLHEETAHLAAVKLPTPDLNRDEQWLKRFEQEVQTLKKLVNPYLVRLQDSGKAGDVQWLAMDWVEGSTVGERLQVSKKADKPMPLSEIQLILKQVVEGLQYLHSQNVVHRDLKPGNLLMGQDGSVKVADFGLAKQVGGGQSTFMTQTGTLAGTVDYMAPEQKEGLAVTTAADIYALGIIWHELLTGKRPGGGRLRLQRFRSDSPPSWESIMEDCLDREASERPSLSRIKQALEGEIFEAQPRRQLQGDAGDDAKNIPPPSVDPPSGIPKFNPEKPTTDKPATKKPATKKPATKKPPALKNQSNAKVQILKGIKWVYSEEAEETSFVVYTFNRKKNYYIQFTPVKRWLNESDNSLILDCEVVGNEHLKPKYKFGSQQISILRTLGWEQNIERESQFHWEANVLSQDEKESLADLIVETAEQVFGETAIEDIETPHQHGGATFTYPNDSSSAGIASDKAAAPHPSTKTQGEENKKLGAKGIGCIIILIFFALCVIVGWWKNGDWVSPIAIVTLFLVPALVARHY